MHRHPCYRYQCKYTRIVDGMQASPAPGIPSASHSRFKNGQLCAGSEFH
ncbi:hypothetical protein SF83666_b65210 (plasmid) [Sinorhizobium fredii CCBAU 83666]|nr:hypothetical protein SF83666_b65210 [Sinorhizobium fredii CCBAU 83666]